MDLEQFLNEPTPENYLEALDELVSGAEYDPYGSHLQDLQNEMMGQDFDKVLERVSESASTLILSPVAHHYAAKAATEIGDEKRASFEQFLLSAMMQAMLATGDGTRGQPYVVSIMADELAICGALKFSPSSQAIMDHGDRVLDVLADEDGRELAFDITRIYRTQDSDDNE